MTSAPDVSKLKLAVPKSFVKLQNALLRKHSTEGNLVYQKVTYAIESWRLGEDPRLPVTKWGESRISHIVKYDLPGYFRLIVREHAGFRIPLFVGSHDESEHWLEENKGSDFTIDSVTKKVVFTARGKGDYSNDLGGAIPSRATGPIIDRIPEQLLNDLSIPIGTLQILKKFIRFETIDDENTWTLLTGLEYGSVETKRAFIEAVKLLYQDLPEKAIACLRLRTGAALTATESPTEFANALENDTSSDTIVSLSRLSPDQLSRLLSSHSFSDWMLFLHPDQHKLVDKDYSDAARIHGVSGSGKTCVLVHRAVWLAERYEGQSILILALNKSLCRLISFLVDRLCSPARRSRIRVLAIYEYCYSAVKTIESGRLIESFDPKSGEDLELCWRDFLKKMHAMQLYKPVADAIELRRDTVDAAQYVLDELIWIRSGFGFDERAEYLSCQRVGRGIAFPIMDRKEDELRLRNTTGLPDDTRQRMLDLLAAYEEYMQCGGLLDEDGVSLAAWKLRDRIKSYPSLQARCVLVDEEQDCSTVELAVINEIPTERLNGLLLVGDPVQKVFPRQHDLQAAGIDILGRAAVLKYNYRNTRQILEAAFSIIRELAQESTVAAEEVLNPEFAFRDGSLPSLYECDSTVQQVDLVMSFLQYYESELGTVCVCTPDIQSLAQVESRLRLNNLRFCRLGLNTQVDDQAVKTGLLENVKGHEFEKVFLLDLSDSALPTRGRPREEWWRDAFQVYVAMTRARDELIMSYVYNPSVLLKPVYDWIVKRNAKEWLTGTK